MNKNLLKVIDVGHSGNTPDDAISILETTVSNCLYENKARVIKVITGHGSGIMRNMVRQWCKEQEGRFKGVIYGENYDMFNNEAVKMRDECFYPNDIDYGKNNSAVTYIWLR